MARTVLSVLLCLGVSVGAASVGAPRAGAHARVVATSPVGGTTLDQLPTEVAVHFADKLVTVEGDPLRVYGPTGERVDRGDARSRAGGTVLEVSLDPKGSRPGVYQVEYRVISEDTHLVTGHFTFSSRSGRETGTATPAAPVRRDLAAACSSCGQLPHLIAGVAVFLVVVGFGRRVVARGRDRQYELWHPSVPTRPVEAVATLLPAPTAPTAPAAVRSSFPEVPPPVPDAGAPAGHLSPGGPPDGSPRRLADAAAQILAGQEGWWPRGAAPPAHVRRRHRARAP